MQGCVLCMKCAWTSRSRLTAPNKLVENYIVVLLNIINNKLLVEDWIEIVGMFLVEHDIQPFARIYMSFVNIHWSQRPFLASPDHIWKPYLAQVDYIGKWPYTLSAYAKYSIPKPCVYLYCLQTHRRHSRLDCQLVHNWKWQRCSEFRLSDFSFKYHRFHMHWNHFSLFMSLATNFGKSHFRTEAKYR